MKFTSRAVIRFTQPGLLDACAHCDQQIKFRARLKPKHVIANVYGGRPSRWLRVELFHADCYLAAGMPYGDPGVVHLTNRKDTA